MPIIIYQPVVFNIPPVDYLAFSSGIHIIIVKSLCMYWCGCDTLAVLTYAAKS